MKKPFSWDYNSDQPYQLKDRNFKKVMRQKEGFSLLMTILSSLFILPIAFLAQLFISKRKISTQDFFGMSINLDKEPQKTEDLVHELALTTLLIRFPLWEMERIQEYVIFVKNFQDKKILINIMQDREHVEDLELLQKDLFTLFQALAPYVHTFQVGTTINRAKWGFFSVHEYLRFYQTAYKLKQKEFKDLKLLGPSVIDFEYHFTTHAIFNFFALRYDGISALLYVDRRGAPENTQMGLNLLKKINLLDALARLSPKTKREIYITETNWPLSNTAPFAPTSEHECVSVSLYTEYMLRYYLLSFASQKVNAVYWHQLIAPGYGLIDSHNGLEKREAFEAFKVMLHQLNETEFVSYSSQNSTFVLIVKNHTKTTSILWSLQPKELKLTKKVTCYNYLGKETEASTIQINTKPIYVPENIHGL